MEARHTIKDAAKILEMHEMTVQKLVSDGFITSFKEGVRRFIRAEDLDRVLELRKIHGSKWMDAVHPVPPTDKRPNGRSIGSARRPVTR